MYSSSDFGRMLSAGVVSLKIVLQQQKGRDAGASRQLTTTLIDADENFIHQAVDPG